MESSWPEPVPPVTYSPFIDFTVSTNWSTVMIPESLRTQSTKGSTPIIAISVKVMMSMPRFSCRIGVVRKELSVTRIVWSGSLTVVRWISVSAPEPPPLLFGTSGRRVSPFFSATDWMKRAIWCDPPPAPAMMTKSMGLRGCQSAAKTWVGAAAKVAAQASPRKPRFEIVLALPPLSRRARPPGRHGRRVLWGG